MRVRLNLATAPLENNRRFLTGAGLAGALGLALFVVLLMQTTRAWRENRDLRDDVARYETGLRELRKERRHLEDFFNQADTRRVTERAAFLNSLIERRSFPWTQVFTSLERYQPYGVRIVSVAPRMEKEHVLVKVVIGADSDESKRRFLKAVLESREFSEVRLGSESRPARSEEGDVVVLELLARFVPPPSSAKGAP
jgi:hypothetical protein